MSCIPRYTYDKNLELIQPLNTALYFSRFWSPIGPKFGRKVDGAKIHAHTWLECYGSNSYETCQYWCRFELWPLCLQKSVKLKTRISCHVSLLDVPMINISSGVIALFVLSVLVPWWPRKESDWTEIWSGTYSYRVVYLCKGSDQ
jgi:hypothetical protein